MGQPQKSVQLKFLVAKKETKPIEGIIFSSDLLTDEGCLDDEPPKLVSACINTIFNTYFKHNLLCMQRKFWRITTV